MMRSKNDGSDIRTQAEKIGSDEISGRNQIGSDTFENGSDVIRYPKVILSPAVHWTHSADWNMIFHS